MERSASIMIKDVLLHCIQLYVPLYLLIYPLRNLHVLLKPSIVHMSNGHGRRHNEVEALPHCLHPSCTIEIACGATGLEQHAKRRIALQPGVRQHTTGFCPH
eukprot:gnl/TRDRNA2_/TRDRNA2_78217_c0_seq1.p1 gnl/TRDRNA2_/TRDRNA2_78217_c0~~gnl/TRDRNA2_/TRDRNA2_78217_c0_seq1.p1  ORF type:complete len:102 (+),score=7.85 gnl/TRDRNA2_/TRDRNA2_78217_c0_seq1:408-713(+)